MSAKVSESAEADISGMATRLEAQAKTHASLTAELTKDNKLLQAQHNPALTRELEQKLASAGFPSFSISKGGEIVYNPPATGEPTKASVGNKIGAAFTKPTPPEIAPAVARVAPVAPPVAPLARVTTLAGPPTQADFVDFADMVATKASEHANFNVNASGFTAEFGAANAAILNRLGLTSVSLEQSHVVATFAKPGEISFGTTPLSYGTTLSMNFSAANGAVDLSDINGLKGQVFGISAELKSIDIGPADPRTKLSDLKAEAQIGLLDTTIEQQVSM